jgi:hypothetical protein
MTMPRTLAALLALALAAWASPSRGESEGVLTLDGLSYLEVEGGRTLAIPAGSTIRFVFADPSADGAVGFRVERDGVAIPPIALDEGGTTLSYTLDAPIQGTMRREAGARRIDFTALLRSMLASADGTSSSTYSLRFTTETAAASDVAGQERVEVEGMRMVEGANYVQLVGATANRPDAAAEAGSALSAVLSGSFDRIPER